MCPAVDYLSNIKYLSSPFEASLAYNVPHIYSIIWPKSLTGQLVLKILSPKEPKNTCLLKTCVIVKEEMTLSLEKLYDLE